MGSSRGKWQRARVILENLRKGNTIQNSCKLADIAYFSFYRWRHNKPKFDALVRTILESRVQIVEDKLYNKALEGDNCCMIFWLKNRAGWKDSPSVVVETGTQVKTPHAVVFSAVKEDCIKPVKDECQTSRI